LNERRTAFGQKLARERGQRGLSLEELAAAIKVRPALLQALEEGRFDDLPPALFVEGYVKAYARHLGLPDGPLAAEFKSIVRFSPPVSGSVERPEPVPELQEGRPWASWLAALLLLAAVCVAAYFLVGYIREKGQIVEETAAVHPARGQGGTETPGGEASAPKAPAVPQNTPSQALESPSPRPELAPITQPPVEAKVDASQAGPLETPAAAVPKVIPPEGDLVLVASRPCWCETWADGVRKIYRQLAPGETVALKGKRFKISLGNAGAVELFYHGAAVALPREEGRVVKDLSVPPEVGNTPP